MIDAKDLKLEIVTKARNDGLLRPVVYSEEATKVLNVRPVKTEWGWDQGRPIYGRLPMISEAYQKSYDIDHAAVYLDPSIPIAVGPGTLQVLKYERDWRILDVQSGTITWEFGELNVERLRIDTASLDSGRGLQDGVYQVGYRLKRVPREKETLYPGYAKAYAEETSIGEILFAYDISGDTSEHRAAYAITDQRAQSWWPNDYYGADGYLVGTHYTFDFKEPTSIESFNLHADADKAGANLALYTSEDAILWRKRGQYQPTDSGWSVDSQGDDVQYYRLFFWDGNVSINHITFTGTGYIRDRQVLFEDSIAEPYIENMYDAIEDNHILLAAFTVIGGAIHSVDDKRRVTYEKYQPVASWLTKFSDEQIRCRFNDVVRYAQRSMAPSTASYHYYDEMDDSLCWGLGEVSLGSETDVPIIRYPTEIELIDPTVEPTSIDHVLQPVSDGHIATRPYAQTTLQNWSLDNGLY